MSTGQSFAMLPWFVRDYVAATRHFSLAERGAYTDLLFFAWEMGPLPREPERLARLLGCSVEEFNSVWPAIGPKFMTAEQGLINARLEEHRLKSIDLSSKRAVAGQAGGKQRAKQFASKRQAIALARGEANAEAKLKPPSPSPSPNPSPGLGVLEDSDSRPRDRTPASFHRDVIAAYHELLPDLPRVKAWPPKRRQALDARIRERCKEGRPANTIDYWRGFFESVAASDFLTGRSKGSKDGFRPDLEWLVRPENFLKVIEGRYENRSSGENANGGVHAR